MTRKIINVGTADKGNGDPIRVAFSKANDNFAELYNILSNNTGGSIITTDVIGSVFADDSTLLVDGINGSIPYSVLSGAPTIPTSFSSLVNGAQTVSLSSSPVSGTTFSSGLTIHRLSGSMANITSDINKVLQIATQTSNGRNEWSFGTNGSLTFPDNTVQTTAWTGIANALRSEGNINIEINLSDSTLRRWRFGEDGDLTFPDNTNQTTAWTGSVSSLVNGSKTVSLGSNGTLTLPSQPNLLTNVNQIFTTKIYKDAKTPTPTPAEITTAYDYWIGEQAVYNDIRFQDASSIAPATRSWAGLPPWEAYPLIVGFTGLGLPPPGNLATAAQSATNAYLSWKELVSNLEIVNGNQTIIFENTGNLILPGTVSMNGKLSLGPTLGGIHANQSTGIISIGDYIDADTGYGLAPSTTIAIGGAANVFQISTYGPPAKTWTFARDGNLQIPGNLQISGDIRSEREINIDINLSDSTLRRWRFGEDGNLEAPGIVSATGLRTSEDTIRLGNNAGQTNQGGDSVAVGGYAGSTNQGLSSVAVGVFAGWTSQGSGAVAVGQSAGLTSQGLAAVAIGGGAGANSQGQFAVAIGYNAGETNQSANSIVINASGSAFNSAAAGFYVKPVRQSDTANAMYYNSSTGEITYSDTFSFSVAADDSTQRAISNNESIKFTGAGGVTTASDAEGNITITGSKVIGEWLVTNGTSTYSFTLPSDGTYVMWVKGNIANGIITWNATASVTNTNVPAIGSQYAWNYTGGGSPILLTAIPDQIRGSAGTISTDATYAGTTSNRFDFGISNTSGANQTVYYGYTKIS